MEVKKPLECSEYVAFKSGSELSVSTFEITVTESYHIVNGGTIKTINGGTSGYFLVLSAKAYQTVTITHNVGNIKCKEDRTLNGDNGDTITFIYNGSDWCMISYEVNHVTD